MMFKNGKLHLFKQNKIFLKIFYYNIKYLKNKNNESKMFCKGKN